MGRGREGGKGKGKKGLGLGSGLGNQGLGWDKGGGVWAELEMARGPWSVVGSGY